MKLLQAKPIRQKRLEALKARCQKLEQIGVSPSMKVILVGEHPPSIIYTRNKKKFMESFGALCEIVKLPGNIEEHDFVKKLQEVVNDKSVHGAFVQLPLPSQLKHLDVGEFIPPEKDVDGLHSQNLYRILHGKEEGTLLPCTPKGVMNLLFENNIDVAGKEVVVIGRSMIVGKPMSLLLLNANATVTTCHSKTKNIKEITQKADIIISAVGNPRFFGADYLNPNRDDQILIDVGINHDQEGKLCGDMDFDQVKGLCGAITPVPGGVGPMTILTLAENLMDAAEKISNKEN